MIEFDFKRGRLALSDHPPKTPGNEDFYPIGHRWNYQTKHKEFVFRHIGDWNRWSEECRSYKQRMLDENPDYAEIISKYPDSTYTDYSHISPENLYHWIWEKDYPVAILLGYRAECTTYGFCKEDGDTDFISPIFNTQEECVDWLADNMGLVGSIHPVYYDPFKGLDDIDRRGSIIHHVPTDVWLVMSHPEFDRVVIDMPDGYTRKPSKMDSERIRDEMRNRIKRGMI